MRGARPLVLGLAALVLRGPGASAHKRHPSWFNGQIVLDGLDCAKFNADGFAKLSMMGGVLMLILKDEDVDSTGVRAFDRDSTFADVHLDRRRGVNGCVVHFAYKSRQRCVYKRKKLLRAIDDGTLVRLLKNTESTVITDSTLNVQATKLRVIRSTCTGGGKIGKSPGLKSLDIAIIVMLCVLCFILSIMVALVYRQRQRKARNSEEGEALVEALPEYELNDQTDWSEPAEELNLDYQEEDDDTPARRRGSTGSAVGETSGVAII